MIIQKMKLGNPAREEQQFFGGKIKFEFFVIKFKFNFPAIRLKIFLAGFLEKFAFSKNWSNNQTFNF